jgi:hypothetical protein
MSRLGPLVALYSACVVAPASSTHALVHHASGRKP